MKFVLTIVLTLLTVWPAIVVKAQETVPALDLQRYVGRWYEIARLPNRFQKQCVADVTADYRLMPNATMEVINRCKIADDSIKTAIGEARMSDQANKLQVRFAPNWLSWLPSVWGNYSIIELDPAYSIVTIASTNHKYLWILARTESISESDYKSHVSNANKLGFDTSKLVKTRQ